MGLGKKRVTVFATFSFENLFNSSGRSDRSNPRVFRVGQESRLREQANQDLLELFLGGIGDVFKFRVFDCLGVPEDVKILFTQGLVENLYLILQGNAYEVEDEGITFARRDERDGLPFFPPPIHEVGKGFLCKALQPLPDFAKDSYCAGL